MVLLALVVSACGRVEPSPTASSLAPGPTGTATQPVPVATAPEESVGPPPLNEFEQVVVAALAELGLEGWRAETSFREANMWVRIDDRRQLTVHAIPLDRDPGLFVAISTRSVRGIQVEKGEPLPYGDMYQFRCRDLLYTIGGSAPPPFANLDAFLGVLDCPPTG